MSLSWPAPTLPPPKMQAKIFISFGGGVGGRSGPTSPRIGPSLETWINYTSLAPSSRRLGRGAVNLPPNLTKLPCEVWPVLAGPFIMH